MANGSQSAAFDTELRLAGAFTGSAQLLGTLTNNPNMLLIANDTASTMFLADNPGSTNGITLIPGKAIVLDMFSDRDAQTNMFTWNIGTSFYITRVAGAGDSSSSVFRIAVIYGK